MNKDARGIWVFYKAVNYKHEETVLCQLATRWQSGRQLSFWPGTGCVAFRLQLPPSLFSIFRFRYSPTLSPAVNFHGAP